MASLDWSQCSAVESVPGKVSGAWVLKGTRMPVSAIVENTLDEHGLTPVTATLYLCGNPEMIVAVDECAQARGFDPEQVRKELYWPKGRTHGVAVGAGATVVDADDDEEADDEADELAGS